MTTSPRLGVQFVPTLPPARLPSLARAAEAAGLDEIWVWEDCFRESGIASAAIALASTERITVGIGLMPAPLRNVALTAMELATLAGTFPGRLRAGVGHGVQDWMAQVGGKVDSPLTLLREYATALRTLLDGGRLTVSGRYVQLDDVGLDWPPSVVPPLYLGGAGPKSLGLAGELGDGALLAAALTDDEVAAACASVRAGAGDKKVDIVLGQIVATGPGARARLQTELPKWGKAADAPIGVAGDAAQIARWVRTMVEAGVSSVGFQPTEDEPDLDSYLAFLGNEVKPLLT